MATQRTSTLRTELVHLKQTVPLTNPVPQGSDFNASPFACDLPVCWRWAPWPDSALRLADLHFRMRLGRRSQQVAEHALEFGVFRQDRASP